MNLSKISKLFVYSFIGLFVYSFITAAAYGQSAVDLTAYPSTFTLSTQPGTTLTQHFRIRNNSNTPLTLSISAKKLTTDSLGNTTIKDFTPLDTYASWISFDKATIAALPREWSDVGFTLQIPKDAGFGYYYVLYIAPKQNTATPNQPQATLTGSLAIPVLLTVNKPGATVSGKLLSFVVGSFYNEYLPVQFLTTFTNTGNLHIRPTGNIFIKDWTGTTIATLVINNTGGSILPSGKRTYTTLWDDSFITKEPIMQDDTILKDANGNPKTHLVFHWDRILRLRMGKYTAIALTVIPTPQRDISFETSTTFWVFPWKVVGLGLLVILFTAIGLINTGKSIYQTIRKVIKK